MNLYTIKKRFYLYSCVLWWLIAILGFVSALFYNRHLDEATSIEKMWELSFYYWVPAVVWTLITPLIVGLYKKLPIRKGKVVSVIKHVVIMLLLIPVIRVVTLYIDFSLKEIIGLIDASPVEVLGSVLWIIPASSTKGMVCYTFIIGCNYYFDIQLNTKSTLKQGLKSRAEKLNSTSESGDLTLPHTPDRKTIIMKRVSDGKLFLNPEFSIEDLSKEVGFSTRTISNVINGELERNFLQFINEFRVEEMKSRLTDPKMGHLTIHGISIDSGFNSKATANRIFKSYTGLTPSEYKEAYFGNRFNAEVKSN